MPLVTADEVAQVLNWPEGSDLTELEQPCAAADAIILSFLDEAKGPHDEHPNDKEAAMNVAIQIYVSRQSPGGLMQMTDYQPSMVPHLLGPGLAQRIYGLIGICRRHRGMTVA